MSSFLKVPEGADFLKSLYESQQYYTEKKDEVGSFEGFVYSRLIITPLTIPASLCKAISFEGQAFTKASTKLCDLDLIGALKEFLTNTLSAFKCTAFAVCAIADTFFGLFIGNQMHKLTLPSAAIQAQNALTKDPISYETYDDLHKLCKDILKKLENATNEISTLKNAPQPVPQDNRGLLQQIKTLEEDLKIAREALDTLKATATQKEQDSQAQLTHQNELTQKIAALEEQLKDATDAQLLDGEKNTQLQNELNQQVESLQEQLRTAEGIAIELNDQKNTIHQNELTQKIAALEVQLKDAAVLQTAEDEKNSQLQVNLRQQISTLEDQLKGSEEARIKQKSECEESKLTATFIEQQFMDQLEALREEIKKLLENQRTATDDETSSLQSSSSSESSSSPQFFTPPSSPISEAENEIYVKAPTPVKIVPTAEGWKQERYQETFSQLVEKFEQENITVLQAMCREGNHIEQKVKDLFEHLKSFETAQDPLLYYREFQIALRAIVREMTANPLLDIQDVIKTELGRLTTIWFTALNMDDFYTSTVHQIARIGDTALDNDFNQNQYPLATMLDRLMKGIDKASAEYTTTTVETKKSQVSTVWRSFDPLFESNVPSQLVTYVYKNTETNEQKEIVHVRHSVPVNPLTAPTSVDSPWVYDSIELAPEYMNYLNQLKSEKKKLLVVLHLNPAYASSEPSLAQIMNVGDWQTQMEGKWIKLYKQLANSPEYKDVIDLSLLPMDGVWMKKAVSGNSNLSQNAFANSLVQAIDDNEIILPFDKDGAKVFTNLVFKETWSAYFPEITSLTKEQRLAFVGFFYSRLVEKLSLLKESDVVQRNCKDAIDRTLSIFAADLGDKQKRLGEFKREGYEKFTGTILGPALAVMKRALLHHRADLMNAAVTHLENHETPVKYEAVKGFEFAGIKYPS